MKKEERLERAVGAAMACLRDLSANITAKETLVYIYNLLAPAPPEMEEVEIERFVIFYPDGSTSHVLTREGLQGFDCKGGTAKRISHTLKRPKPQTVERTVSVENCEIANGGLLYNADGSPALFQNHHKELNGKRGTVSFTYTEDPK